LFDPLFRSTSDSLGPLFFVVSNINMHSGILVAVVAQRRAGHKLQRAHCFAALANQKTVQVCTRNMQLNNIVFVTRGINISIQTKKRQHIF